MVVSTVTFWWCFY